MSIDTISQRLQTYTIQSKQAEENALKEICQEIALAGLARSGFFKKAIFQGGTSLRILHGLNRFSEDLDFLLLKQKIDFIWAPYMQAIQTEFEAFGLSLEVSERSKASDVIKKAFLKEDSFGLVLKLKYRRSRSDTQKILIKLEIDTNPPLGSNQESHFLEYPYAFSIVSQDLPSLFAGKCHALLCRKYTKGRDWYDFIWYIQRKTSINYQLLENSLAQTGPYKDSAVKVSKYWLIEKLNQRINELDWKTVSDDVRKFIPIDMFYTIENWDTPLFLAIVKKLESYL